MRPDSTILLNPRRGLQLTTGLLFVLAGTASVSHAQDEGEALEAARACSEIADDAARLACLDAALGLSTPAREEPPGRTREPAAAERPAPVSEPTVRSRESRESRRRAERDADDDRASAAGAQELRIRVVELRQNAFGVTTFITDDGISWVQRSGNDGRYPEVPFDATLEPAMGDSFFLVSPLGGRRVRVAAER